MNFFRRGLHLKTQNGLGAWKNSWPVSPYWVHCLRCSFLGHAYAHSEADAEQLQNTLPFIYMSKNEDNTMEAILIQWQIWWQGILQFSHFYQNCWKKKLKSCDETATSLRLSSEGQRYSSLFPLGWYFEYLSIVLPDQPNTSSDFDGKSWTTVTRARARLRLSISKWFFYLLMLKVFVGVFSYKVRMLRNCFHAFIERMLT